MTPETQTIIVTAVVGLIAIIKDYLARHQIEKLVEHDEKLVALLLTDHQVAVAKLDEIRERQQLIESLMKGDLKS